MFICLVQALKLGVLALFEPTFALVWLTPVATADRSRIALIDGLCGLCTPVSARVGGGRIIGNGYN
jgi:hypothetical protein